MVMMPTQMTPVPSHFVVTEDTHAQQLQPDEQAHDGDGDGQGAKDEDAERALVHAFHVDLLELFRTSRGHEGGHVSRRTRGA